MELLPLINSCNLNFINIIFRWRISATGLLYDRNWAFVQNGLVLTQKRFPWLCSICVEVWALILFQFKKIFRIIFFVDK